MRQVRAAVAAALRDGDHTVNPLERVCRACVALLPVDGASMSVISGTQHRETLFASDEIAARIESIQFSLGEGPCFQAFETRRPVLVADLARDSAQTWPVFASEIADLPVAAVFAFPVQSGAIGIGALDMYRRQPSWLTVTELATALQVVDVAAAALLGLPIGSLDGELDEEWLTAIPAGRMQVHQATGMLIAEFGIPAEQALARLRGYAFVTGRLVDDLARDITTRRLRLADLDI